MTDQPAIQLPRDQYAHAFAPTEWWWYTGTLTSGKRTFGFEINAASFSEVLGQFTELMVTDVDAKTHYQTTTLMNGFDPFWAETDLRKPWYARLGGPPGSNGAVELRAPLGEIMPMSVIASFQDDLTKTACSFNLLMTQTDAPLLVWGTGEHMVDPKGKTPLDQYNYYYSYTKLKTAGTLRIGGEIIPVTGLTWMDHARAAMTSTSS